MKKFLSAAALILISPFVFSFDWPQKEIMSDTFHTYFGQFRGGLISPSLVFSGSDEIKTAEAGYVTAVLGEHDEETDIFPSTLGNAVILVHDDSMMTIYANLDEEGQNQRYALSDTESGSPLGYCGISGWQEGNALLEFQVVDLKNKAFVNPRILMPRFGNEHPLTITNVCAVNKKGSVFDLNSQKVLASGQYMLYRDRQNIAMPYKTTVFLNGAATDTITWDTLIENKGKLSASGSSAYPVEQIYPDSKKQLLGTVNIPKGRSKITIAVADLLGKEKTITYTVDAF